MKQAQKYRNYLFIITVLFSLISCGGGGGSESENLDTVSNEYNGNEGALKENILDDIESASLNISEIWIRDAKDYGVEYQVLPAPKNYDLIPSTDGFGKILATLDIPDGEYDRARIIVASGEMRLSNDLFVSNGRLFTTEQGNLKLPSAAQNGIKINFETPVKIIAAEPVELELNLDLSNSFVFNGSPDKKPGVNAVLFKPIFYANFNSTTGSLSLTVSGNDGITCAGNTIPNASVTLTDIDELQPAINGELLNGKITFLNLQPGFYNLNVKADGYEPLTVSNIEISVATSNNLGELTIKPAAISSTKFNKDMALLMSIMSNVVYSSDANGFNPTTNWDSVAVNSDLPLIKDYENSFNLTLAPGELPLMEKYQGSCWKLAKWFDDTKGKSTISQILPQFFIAYNVKTNDIVVSFEGSSDNGDWLVNASIEKVNWTQRTGNENAVFDRDGNTTPDAVHHGFNEAYQLIYYYLGIYLDEAINNYVTDTSTSRIYFTGHSLGGALATLASLDYTNYLVTQKGYQRENVIMYTFGAPRSITTNIKNQFHNIVPNGHAIAAKDDPVPHVPVRTTDLVIPSYTHIKKLSALSTNIIQGKLPVNANLKTWEYTGKLTEHYFHIGNSRIEYSNGLAYKGCTVKGLNIPAKYGKAGHDQISYIRRVQALISGSSSIPAIGISSQKYKTGRYLRLSWSKGVQGPCDWVGLYKSSNGRPAPTNPDNYEPLGWQWVVNGSGYFNGTSYYTTYTNPYVVDPFNQKDFWVGYVDGFGRFIKTRRWGR